LTSGIVILLLEGESPDRHSVVDDDVGHRVRAAAPSPRTYVRRRLTDVKRRADRRQNVAKYRPGRAARQLGVNPRARTVTTN
jgi:hypothetical protein